MIKPKYPIYIISKGRYENGLRLTQEMLEKYGVPYRMVVEDSEFDAYAENVPEEKIIALPKDFKGDVHAEVKKRQEVIEEESELAESVADAADRVNSMRAKIDGVDDLLARLKLSHD